MQMASKIMLGICVSVIIVSILLSYVFSKKGFFGSFQEIMPQNVESTLSLDKLAYEELQERDAPTIMAISQKVKKETKYNVKEFIQSATDSQGKNLLNKIKVKDNDAIQKDIFYATKAGIFIITFFVFDDIGIKCEKSIVIIAE